MQPLGVFSASVRGLRGRDAALQQQQQQRSCWEGRPFILLVTGWREQSLEVPEKLMRIPLKGSVARSSQSASGGAVCLYGDGVTFTWASSEFCWSFWFHGSSTALMPFP